MEIKEDKLTGLQFHGCLRVLGWTKIVGAKRYYAILCDVCSQDPELFGKGVFETTKESLDRGYKPCGCGSSYRWSKEQYEIRIKRKADSMGFIFLGWVDGFKTGSSKIALESTEGEWHSRANQFIKRGSHAFNRGKTTLDDGVIISKFFASGAFHKDTKFSRERRYDKWYWKVECPVCNSVGYSQPQHLQRGSRCCQCGNYKQVYCYVNLIKDNDYVVALKFGVSRTKGTRLKYQSRESIYDVELFGIWEFPEKVSCLSAEKCCKEAIVCGILSKEEFGDGYTETTSATNLERVIKIFETYGGLRIQ